MIDFYLSDDDKHFLLKLARKSVERHLGVSKEKDSGYEGIEIMPDFEAGAFVSVYKFGELRGCIGRMESNEKIDALVQKMAISAASSDHRFESINPKELNEIEFELSILTPRKKINSIHEFDPSIHGIYIEKGGSSGTFLPQVAKETGWDKEELLGRCARDKAGIGWTGWKNADLFVYEVISFSDSDFK